jgi:hypothetical protein
MNNNDLKKKWGFSILEALVALGLMSTVAIAFYGTLFSTSTTVRTGLPISAIEESGRRVLESMSSDIRPSSSTVVVTPTDGSTTPAPGSPSVAVTLFETSKLLGVNTDGTANYTSPTAVSISYECILETGETYDGLDNDKDGLIDEGMIYREEDNKVTPLAYGLSWNVSLGQWNASVSRSGNRFSLSFTLQSTDANREIISRTFSTSVQMRN